MTAIDGRTVTLRMSDLKNEIKPGPDGSVLVTVSDMRGDAQVQMDAEKYERMKVAYEISKASWQDRYSRWRDEGEYQGWVAGYDGTGAKAARRTEF